MVPAAALCTSDLRGGRSGTFIDIGIMTFIAIPGITGSRRLRAASSLFILLGASAAIAQTAGETSLPSITVTASRFASDPAFVPLAATVITAEQIREAGAGNVNEAIRRIGGVFGRQSLNGSQDFSLDLRGFGTNSDQNMVILVDGIRISENELSTALTSSIPIELVERIEIVRGGSSVLYGEGGTGGIIQIVTKRPQRNAAIGSIVAEAGSYRDRELRVSGAKDWNGLALDVHASTQRTDNYRDNNALKQDNFSGGLQWGSNEGRIGVRADLSRQASRLPGALTLAQFNANPRQANTPNDFGSNDVNRYTFFAERRLGDWDAAVELSRRNKTAKGTFVSAFGTFDSTAESAVTQLSPRVRHILKSGDVKNEFVAGLDFARWNRDTNSTFGGFPSSAARATQKSRAVYLRDEIRIDKARIALGARRETFDKDFTDPLANPLFGSANAYTQSRTLNAWELQGSYAFLPELTVFAKAGRSYRVANVDENGSTPVVNRPLEPQISRDLELGTTLGKGDKKLTVRVFQHRLENEIFFDPTVNFGAGANSNLAPTKREGIELEGSIKLAPAWNLSGSFQHVSAKFTEGANAGKEMVLVPPNTATLRLNWQPGTQHSANVGLQWIDSQRYGGDFNNACSARISAYTTLDARYAYKFDGWEFAVSGTNLTGRDYFTNAFGACQSGIYPDAGRQVKLSVRYSF